jgi:hypothetical protein
MRGLVTVLEFGIGLLVLTLLLSYFTTLAQQQVYASNLAVTREAKEFEAIRAINLLTRYEGSPRNWTSSTVQAMGLSDGSIGIDYSKLWRMNWTAYATTKKTLGVSDFEISVFIPEIGFAYPGNATYSANYSARVQRASVLNNTPITVILLVWKNREGG